MATDPNPVPEREEWPDTGFIDKGAGELIEVELADIEERLSPEALAHVVVDFGGEIGQIRPWRFGGTGDARILESTEDTNILLI